jgi:putative membrane protein
MKKTLILASILMATAGSATFAQSTAEKTGVNSVMGVAPKTEEKGVSIMP